MEDQIREHTGRSTLEKTWKPTIKDCKSEIIKEKKTLEISKKEKERA